jgi:sterol desaturase/sphingolipid hydroxylase (fatty acid hydroxylase superfamily)
VSATFPFYDASQWGFTGFMSWLALVILAIETMNSAVISVPKWFNVKPIRETIAPLTFTAVDRVLVATSKVITAVWAYHAVRFTWLSPDVRWNFNEATLLNTAVALPALFLVYDLLYYVCHRYAHCGWLYRYIHRHHHRQQAPFRGNDDGINVHPLEIVVSSYLHIAAAFVVITWILAGPGVHVIALILFFGTSALLSGLSHTRHDLQFPVVPSVWKVQHHNTHHSFRNANFGQYSMLWDYLFGTFKA